MRQILTHGETKVAVKVYRKGNSYVRTPGVQQVGGFFSWKGAGAGRFKNNDVVVGGPSAGLSGVDYENEIDPQQRVDRLLSAKLPPHDHLILAGTSMGGYVSTVAGETLNPAGLFLLAPAFYIPDYHR